MKTLRWIACAAVVLSAPVHAEVYKWTDAQGRVQFSDRPPPKDFSKAQVTDIKGVASPAQEQLCASLAEAVPHLMVGLRKSLTPNEARTVGSELDQGLRAKGMDDANFKRLLGMLYAYRAQDETYTSNGAVYARGDSFTRIQQAQLEVKNACMAGRFGRLDAPKTPTQSPNSATSSGTGTGFWVDHNHIATSWHVVKGATSIEVIDANGKQHNARLVSKNDDHDVALIQVFGAQWPHCLSLASAEAGLGAEVFTVGFPQTEILGVKAKLATGVISSRFGMLDDPRTYQISVPVQAGNSGGPLLNKHGEVVGVVASKLNAAQVFKWTGDLPQNVNYAVKVQPLQQLVGPVSASTLSGSGAESLAPQVEKAVVLIRVQSVRE